MKQSLVWVGVLSLLVFTGCARKIDPGIYKASHVGETSTTYMGTIVSARPVIVEDQEYLEKHDMGRNVGALAGGIAGSTIGGGRGSMLAALGGAVMGGTAGAMLERDAKTQQALEYVVQLQDGRYMTVVQGPNPPLAIGQPVYLIKSYNGRSRLVAMNGQPGIAPAMHGQPMQPVQPRMAPQPVRPPAAAPSQIGRAHV